MPEVAGFGHRLKKALDLETVEMEGSVRRPGPSWLLNPRRLEIVLAAAVYPGVHLRSASRLLLQPLPSLLFHVRKLDDRRLLTARRLRGRTTLFVPGLYPRSVEPLLAAWEDPTARAILNALRASRTSPADPLAKASRQPRPAFAKAVGALRSCGAVRQTNRRSVRLSLTPRWDSFERLCHDGVERRLQAFLALLRQEDLHPVAEIVGAGRYRVTVDGPRSRIRFVLPLDPLKR